MGIAETLKYYKPRFVLQFNHWGRTMMLAGAQLLIAGGFAALFYGHIIMLLVGLYSCVLGAALFPFAYPLQQFQKRGFLVVFQQYRIVGPVLVLASLPSYFSLPTILGAVPLTVSGIFYVIAAVRKEKSLNQEQIMKGGRV